MLKSNFNLEQQFSPNPQNKILQTANPVSMEEDYIVENKLGGPLCISDIGLTLEGFQAIDLTYEDSFIIKRSQDLKNALRMGWLQRITRQQYEAKINKKIEKAREEVLQQQQENKLQLLEVDDKTIEAEVININSEGKSSNKPEITISGNANDPNTFVMAYEKYKEYQKSMGIEIEPEEFAAILTENPNLLNNILNNKLPTKPKNNKATMIVPPTNINEDTQVTTVDMMNFNSDQILAGSQESGLTITSINEQDIAEEIDLANDIPAELIEKNSSKRQYKRKS